MPPHDDARRSLLNEWLRKAEDDVQAAELLISEGPGLANPIAFHAQQGVEKYLKAYLSWHQVPFPRTHDIERLLALLEPVDEDLATRLSDASVLTIYGVDARYPGDMPEATIEEAQEAIVLMRRTREAIRAVLPAESE